MFRIFVMHSLCDLPCAVGRRHTLVEGAQHSVRIADTDVTLVGGSDLFGSVVGKTLSNVGVGMIHYDEALRDLGARVLELSNWRELRAP